MQAPNTRNIVQNAWVVDDAEAAARRWSDVYGIGPFVVGEYGPGILVDVLYRGEPGILHMKTAIAYAGGVQIELVQPIGDKACCYRDTVESGTNAFHHMCVWSRDIDADLAHYAERGCPAANTGRVSEGVRFAYVDTYSQLGCMIELLEYSKDLEGLFGLWEEACRSWDGKEAIKYL